ncbi:hypothetical protein BTA51_01150 [Hahella sp. CCB-MM4]|uniref:hypothetical protein n=1 Tax=Hahella sp. (strain CCB-MM4) TaxID=1926491 RepID=UPI000B9B9782|nr:hypothetical protein [Hahella sp. CCB-MM4]OZG75038.1 hypothetical protein BTA51_01150 [Hahella sp. CCB-MM4]
MNKLIVLILVIAGLVYFGYKNKPEEEKGKIIYGEARVSFNFPGREIEGVAVGQRYEGNDCDLNNSTNDFLKACIQDKVCVQTKFECKESVDQKYLHMLNKSDASTHYVHLTAKNEPLKGVVLFWGLTMDESKAVCKKVVTDFNSDKRSKFIAKCI